MKPKQSGKLDIDMSVTATSQPLNESVTRRSKSILFRQEQCSSNQHCNVKWRSESMTHTAFGILVGAGIQKQPRAVHTTKTNGHNERRESTLHEN
jgi:hypothetical protein